PNSAARTSSRRCAKVSGIFALGTAMLYNTVLESGLGIGEVLSSRRLDSSCRPKRLFGPANHHGHMGICPIQGGSGPQAGARIALRMSFIEGVIERARESLQNIVLPEAEEDRTLHAADIIESRGFARVTLVGSETAIRDRLRELGISREFRIIDPDKAEWTPDFIDTFYEMRKARGITRDDAVEQMRTPIPHGVMMLHKGLGDGLVAGAVHSTGDTLRPALQILRTAPGHSLV